MTIDKESVKKWLKKIGKDRFWLAEQCGVSKVAVDRWFTENNFPSAKQIIISRLMSPPVAEKVRNVTMVLQFTPEEWAEIEEYRKKTGETLEEMAEEFILALNRERQKNNGTLPPILEDKNNHTYRPFA